jgi:hypothetical protein
VVSRRIIDWMGVQVPGRLGNNLYRAAIQRSSERY